MKAEALVVIKSGAGLKSADLNGKSDPYVVIQGSGDRASNIKTEQTPVIKKTLDPVWDYECRIPFVYEDGDTDKLMNDSRLPPKVVQFHVWDKDTLTKDDPLGFAEINLGELKLTREKKEVVLNLDTKGTVTLEVSWPEAPAEAKTPTLIADDGSNQLLFTGGSKAKVCMSPDGKYVAQGHNSTIALFNVASGALVGLGEENDDREAMALAFSPDSSQVAWANMDGLLKVFTVPAEGASAGETKVAAKTLDVKDIPRTMFIKLLWTPDGTTLLHVTSKQTVAVKVADAGTEVWRAPHRELDTVYSAIAAGDSLMGVLVSSEEAAGLSLADGTKKFASTIAFPAKNGNIRKLQASVIATPDTVITGSDTVGTEKGPLADFVAWDPSTGKARWQESHVFTDRGMMVATGNGFIAFKGMDSEWGPDQDRTRWHSVLTVVSQADGKEAAEYQLGSGDDAVENSRGARMTGLSAGPGPDQVSVLTSDGMIRVFSITPDADDSNKATIAYKATLAGVGGAEIPHVFASAAGGAVAAGALGGDKTGLQVWSL